MQLPAFTFPKHLELKNAEILIRKRVRDVIMMEALSAHNQMVDTFVLLVNETVRMGNHVRDCGYFVFAGNLQMT